jgi:hypothetical protein
VLEFAVDERPTCNTGASSAEPSVLERPITDTALAPAVVKLLQQLLGALQGARWLLVAPGRKRRVAGGEPAAAVAARERLSQEGYRRPQRAAARRAFLKEEDRLLAAARRAGTFAWVVNGRRFVRGVDHKGSCNSRVHSAAPQRFAATLSVFSICWAAPSREAAELGVNVSATRLLPHLLLIFRDGAALARHQCVLSSVITELRAMRQLALP